MPRWTIAQGAVCKIDLVDVFRASSFVPEIMKDVIRVEDRAVSRCSRVTAMKKRPLRLRIRIA